MARGDVPISDPKVLRALAHPARLAILEHLAATGTATATECAAPAEISAAAASYHLRLLERYGLVEDAGGGSGRERPWRAVVPSFTIDDEGPAGRALLAQLVARGDRWTQLYLANEKRLPKAWRDASYFANKGLSLTAEQAAALQSEIEAMCDRYRESPARGAERYRLFIRGFPERVRRR